MLDYQCPKERFMSKWSEKQKLRKVEPLSLQYAAFVMKLKPKPDDEPHNVDNEG